MRDRAFTDDKIAFAFDSEIVKLNIDENPATAAKCGVWLSR
jgi:hypothetical protein